ncbi:hypothetical protein, partial [Ralstonia pseudosolanacearum]|uniref:hypothetical protein n=1 Tax=Ralstonia pseudosolanacearum TaxID=1310165 RepID=UPI003CF983FC
VVVVVVVVLDFLEMALDTTEMAPDTTEMAPDTTEMAPDSTEMVLDSTEIVSTTKTHSTTMEFPVVLVPLKMEKLRSFPKGEAVMVELVAHPAVVAVVALTMGKSTESVLRGYLNVEVGLDAGVISNVMVLDVATGGQLLMKLLRTLRNWAMQMRA